MSAAAASPDQVGVTIFVHVFYPDIWKEMAAQIAASMPVPFDLIITSPHDISALAGPDTPYLQNLSRLRVENRGRDILPFLTAIENAPPYSIGLKLHTKKSTHRIDGDAWRRSIMASLLGSQEDVAKLLGAVGADRRIGLVAPEGMLLGVKKRTPGYRHLLDETAGRFGKVLTPQERKRSLFIAGSMFWFRHDAVADLVPSQVADLFEKETGQVDATAAHAMERYFSIHAARRGFVTLSTDVLDAASPQSSLETLHGLSKRAAGHQSVHIVQLPVPLMKLHRIMPFLGDVWRFLPMPVRLWMRRYLLGLPLRR